MPKRELFFHLPFEDQTGSKRVKKEKKPSNEAISFQRMADLFERLKRKGLEGPDYRSRDKILEDGTKIQVSEGKSGEEDMKKDTFTVAIFREKEDPIEVFSFQITEHGLTSIRYTKGEEVDIEIGKKRINRVLNTHLIEFNHSDMPSGERPVFMARSEIYTDWVMRMIDENVFIPPPPLSITISKR